MKRKTIGKLLCFLSLAALVSLGTETDAVAAKRETKKESEKIVTEEEKLGFKLSRFSESTGNFLVEKDGLHLVKRRN